MDKLLDTAIEAHGGWDRWQRATELTAQAKIGGALWPAKGRGGLFDDTRITIDPHRPHSEYSPFRVAGQHTVWEPERTTIETDDGRVIDSRRDARSSFADHVRETPWDDHHVIYFSGYAIWTYLTTPFLLRMPGFEAEEIDPWHEGDEQWRRLRVTFPTTVPSHSAEQVFYFDATGILRRHDYTADVIGGMPSANYASEPQTFGGIILPTKRRVYARRPDNTPVLDRVAVAIDLHSVEVSFGRHPSAQSEER